MTTRHLHISTAILLASLLTAASAHAADPREILARSKEAAGGKAWDAVKTLHVRVQIETSGLSGTADSWEDVLTGRNAASFALGPVTGAEGFDGKVNWVVDPTGQVRVSDSGDAREGSANQAYRRSLSYWYPDRWPAQVTDGGLKTEGDRSFHVVRIHPEGGRPFDMWIDGKTFLIDRTVEQGANEVRTDFQSEYREIQGLKFPGKTRSTNGETKYDQLVKLESVEVNPAIDEAKFRMPEGGPKDFSIASGKTTATVPFEFLNHHIFVKIQLDGQGPLNVFFDTGGMNVVTPEVAQRLGLKSEGAIQGRGVGEKSEDVGITRVKEMRLGDVTLANQVFYVFPLKDMEKVEGIPFDGIIGYEVFKRLVVRIDYEKKVATLTLPEAFKADGAGTAVPFTFDEQTPQVEGKIDGIPGRFSLDTGSRSSLDLLGPFAETHGLTAKYAPKFEMITGWGVGGGVRSAVTRGSLLELGSVQVPSPVTEIARTKSGAYADRYLAGNVGNGVFRRFTVTFDYSRSLVYFQPNGSFAAKDAFDRVGLWMNKNGEGFEVVDLAAGGPAAEAGLKAGDTILAVDGQSAKDLVLPEVRARFRESAPGTKVRLSVLSGGKTREVMVTLRDLV
ncbi:MAG TPA: aspartyl protease family protein [Thermoanaerobaculia bacterium]|nr:aspartyl protease family protein [Thermoanaerobaculia bacterium]